MSCNQLDTIITHLLHTVSPHWLEQFDLNQLSPPLAKTITKLPHHKKQLLLLALLKHLAKNPHATEQHLKKLPKSSASLITKLLDSDPKQYIYREMIDTQDDK